ncbi:MAG: phosphodiester glycosidase family protein [Lachnospiraceae bacterium]|nr:phosphodiester glycosidase family protein [Lachnospiraceae bacterium]
MKTRLNTKKRIIIAYYSALLLFTVYAVLDVFVIKHTYQADVSKAAVNPVKVAADEGGSKEPENIITSDEISEISDDDEPLNMTKNEEFDYSYSDDDISIAISNYRAFDTEVFIADVTISSPDLMKTAFAEDAYGKNIVQPTSEQAEDNGAILAINGDYYGARETGYVARNGVLYSDKPSDVDALAVYSDGSMEVIRQDERSAEDLMEKGAMHLFSFGPGLISDGTVTVRKEQDVNVVGQHHPRTSIGMIEKNHYIFLVADGRFDNNVGLTLYQMATILQSFGVKCAYNLDGGGSSTLWFQGSILNHPTSKGDEIQERAVSDIVYIGR